MDKFIIMLEDDNDDRYLTEEVLSSEGIHMSVHFFTNSNEMLEALTAPRKPALVLVDSNSYPDNGISVLRKMKENVSLRDIPVVILSDNNFDHYRSECYSAGAASYIQKPNKMDLTNKKIKTFFKYWFEVAEL
jgi:CheY-like chemotaxis protein